MRILFLTNFYPPHELGGQGRSCQQVVEGLQQRGHDTRVLTSKHGVDRRSTGSRGILRTLYLEMELSPLRHSYIFFFRRKHRERHNLRILGQHLADFQPDILFIWGMWNLSRRLPALGEARCPRRVIYRFAEYWPTLPGQHELYWRAPGRTPFGKILKGTLARLALAILSGEQQPPPLKYEHAICVSTATRNVLADAGIPLAHNKVIHTGLDLELYMSGKNHAEPLVKKGFNLLYAGRLSAVKGVETAIEAMNQLNYRGLCEITLTLAGSGSAEYEKHLRQLVARNSLESRVSFLGHVPHERMPGLMRQYDALLVPSEWPEPFARVVLEGMASGLIVLATPDGGTPEIIRHGENGLLFATGESEDLAEKIELLARDNALQQLLRENGLKSIRDSFSMTRMLDRYEAYLQEVAADGAPCS